MGKIQINQEKAKQILTDARDNLERRLALSVGEGNYNQRPLNDALNALDMQLGRTQKQQIYKFKDSGYELPMLLDKALRKPVKRVLKHVNGVTSFPSPSSLDYSAIELFFGRDDVATKWSIALEQLKPSVALKLGNNVIVHDLTGFSSKGFEDLSLEQRTYLEEFHKQAKPLMVQRVELEKTRGVYTAIGGGALGGVALGLGVGYWIDTSQIYNFYTQLLLARFPVAMLEAAGIAAKPIWNYSKKSHLLRKYFNEESVVKASRKGLDTFAVANLLGPPAATALSATGELTGWNIHPGFDGFANVEVNNINNQIGVAAMWYRDYVKVYGIREGTKRFFSDPFVISNLIVTGAYLASAIIGRSKGVLQIDTGVEAGGEAGAISFDTTIVTALAMTAIYTHYLIKHNQMLKSGIRENIYNGVTRN